MKPAIILSLLGGAAMTAALFYGFTAGDFFVEGARISSMPWGIVSLVDLYTGFLLFSGWIMYREKSMLSTISWIVAMLTLGFFAGSLYVFIALISSQNDWRRFWLGKHA